MWTHRDFFLLHKGDSSLPLTASQVSSHNFLSFQPVFHLFLLIQCNAWVCRIVLKYSSQCCLELTESVKLNSDNWEQELLSAGYTRNCISCLIYVDWERHTMKGCAAAYAHCTSAVSTPAYSSLLSPIYNSFHSPCILFHDTKEWTEKNELKKEFTFIFEGGWCGGAGTILGYNTWTEG